MSAPFIIPFNYQPSGAPAKKTSSYSIPSDKYALVEAISPNFTINGTQMYPSTLMRAEVFAAGSATNTVHLTKPIYIHTANYNQSGGTPGTISFEIGIGNGPNYYVLDSGSTASTSLTNIGSFGLITEGGIYLKITDSANPTVAQVTIEYYSLIGESKFWVPPSTALVGDWFIVTEYNVIS